MSVFLLYKCYQHIEILSTFHGITEEKCYVIKYIIHKVWSYNKLHIFLYSLFTIYIFFVAHMHAQSSCSCRNRQKVRCRMCQLLGLAVHMFRAMSLGSGCCHYTYPTECVARQQMHYSFYFITFSVIQLSFKNTWLIF